MDVRYGVIQKCEWIPSRNGNSEQLSKRLNRLVSMKLHEIEDWEVSIDSKSRNPELADLAGFLNRSLPPQS
jgi:hypothetical protein